MKYDVRRKEEVTDGWGRVSPTSSSEWIKAVLLKNDSSTTSDFIWRCAGPLIPRDPDPTLLPLQRLTVGGVAARNSTYSGTFAAFSWASGKQQVFY